MPKNPEVLVSGTDATRADEHVSRLAELFLRHPAWVDGGRRIAEGACSNVYFSHLPGQAWHLLRHGSLSLLRPGPASTPDFAFRFTPASIERLAAVEGGIGDFAVELFSLITEADEALRVGFRIIEPFPALVRRGYLRLLLDAGPKLLAFGASHGVRSFGQLRRLVRSARRSEPEGWERA